MNGNNRNYEIELELEFLAEAKHAKLYSDRVWLVYTRLIKVTLWAVSRESHNKAKHNWSRQK